MTPFELLEPTSLHEAIALLDPDDAAVRPIAGGTALMLMMKAGVFRPTRLVSLRNARRPLLGIATGPDGALTIGAMTPLSVVERSPEVARVAPVIPRAMRRLSNIRVRNVATVGGNLAHGDPHMDLPPVLIALGAEVSVDRRQRRAQHRGRGPARRLFRDRAGEERADRGAAHSAAGQVARGLSQGHHRLGRGLAGARRRGRARGRGRGGQVRARRRQRRDREGGPAQGGGTGARGRDRRRQDARARRRCRRGRSGVHLRRARLGRLQARAHPRLCRPRRAAGAYTTERPH